MDEQEKQCASAIISLLIKEGFREPGFSDCLNDATAQVFIANTERKNTGPPGRPYVFSFTIVD
jgi:hypothetical protein